MDITHKGFIWEFHVVDEDEMVHLRSLRDSMIFFDCEICECILSTAYSVIMNPLYEAGLLPEDYKHLCCVCSFFNKLGILNLKGYFDCWSIKEDIVTLTFFIPKGILEIRVHDYRKVLFS